MLRHHFHIRQPSDEVSCTPKVWPQCLQATAAADWSSSKTACATSVLRIHERLSYSVRCSLSLSCQSQEPQGIKTVKRKTARPATPATHQPKEEDCLALRVFVELSSIWGDCIDENATGIGQSAFFAPRSALDINLTARKESSYLCALTILLFEQEACEIHKPSS
jgi:hypothetical protein